MDPSSKQDEFALSLVSDEYRTKNKPNRHPSTDEGRYSLALVEKKDCVERPEYPNFHNQLLMHLPGSAASVEDLMDSLQNGAIKVIKEARIKRLREGGNKNKLKKHRVGKKQKLPRRQLLREAEECQDAEPMHVSSLNTLPHFEYLEIAEQAETGFPSELAGFGSLDLSKVENQGAADQSLDRLLTSPSPVNHTHEDLRQWSYEEVRREAAEMLQKLSLSPNSNPEDLASTEEYLLLEPSSKEILQPGHPVSTSEAQDPEVSLHSAYKTQRYLTETPRDNLLCIFVTCPIREMHYEGPYYHEGQLGDQDVSKQLTVFTFPPLQLLESVSIEAKQIVEKHH